MSRLLLIVVLLCVPAFTKPVQACQCREYGTPICAQFWRSDVIFVGQVIDIKPLQKKPDNYDYSIEARHFIDEIEGRSQRMNIPPGNSSGLKLVIQRINRNR